MPRNRTEYILLLDYYGELLTKHQVDILNDYYNNDLSMNEIALNYSISKSAVQDLIKRSILQLQKYEKVLKLINRDNKLNKILFDMESLNNKEINTYIKKIRKIK